MQSHDFLTIFIVQIGFFNSKMNNYVHDMPEVTCVACLVALRNGLKLSVLFHVFLCLFQIPVCPELKLPVVIQFKVNKKYGIHETGSSSSQMLSFLSNQGCHFILQLLFQYLTLKLSPLTTLPMTGHFGVVYNINSDKNILL